jgi:mercuric ion transport protein
LKRPSNRGASKESPPKRRLNFQASSQYQMRNRTKIGSLDFSTEPGQVTGPKFAYLTLYSGTECSLTLKNMSELKHTNARKGNGLLIAGILSAIGASICCVGPLVLLALGISGAWIGSLTAFEPYRPIFIGLTLLFLGFAFYRLYLARPSCSAESACANPRTLKRQRVAFWIVTVLVLGLIAVPWFAPLFY